MPWYYHAESDSVFQTEHPLGMDSPVDLAFCEEITEEQAQELQASIAASMKKGQAMTVIEGEATRVLDLDEEAAAGAAQAVVEAGSGGEPQPITIDDDRLVKLFLKIRGAKADFVAAHEKVLTEKYERPLKLLQTELKRRMQDRGNTGLKTEYGTVYLAETLKVSIADGAVFVGWGKEHDCLEHFYEQRIKAGEVKKFMEDHNGEVPPGLSIFRETEARVRQPSKRGARAVGNVPPEGAPMSNYEQ